MYFSGRIYGHKSNGKKDAHGKYNMDKNSIPAICNHFLLCSAKC
jgi:hypothetical protein